MTRQRGLHDHAHYYRIRVSRGVFDFDRSGPRHPTGPTLTDSTKLKVGDWVRPSPQGIRVLRGKVYKGSTVAWTGRRGQIVRSKQQRVSVMWEGRTSLDHVHASLLELVPE